MAELNYTAFKDALLNTQESIEQLMTAKDPKQVSEIFTADTLQAAGNQAFVYQKKVNKVLRDSNKEFVNVVYASIDQLQDGFQDWINSVVANAPAGSDAVLSSLKTVYSSALQGFEQFRAASKEALLQQRKLSIK